MIDLVKRSAGIPADAPTYNHVRLACWAAGIKCDMRYCRKIHGSWLHQYGIPETVIDFLQGRVSPSVFSRHYLTPNENLKDHVFDALKELQKRMII
jgi:intergrase/recombinase